MSTHSLDASGQRSLTTVVNDPARTVATVSAKQGDDVVVTLGAFNYTEIAIPKQPGWCEIVTRKRTERHPKRDDQGELVRDGDRQVVYEEVELEDRVLRIKGHVSLSAHTGEGVVSTPHTTFRIVNLENESNQPMWLWGDVVSVEPIDLGYGEVAA